MKKISWIVFGLLSVAIGFYPVVYGLLDMNQGLLGGKPGEVLASSTWFWFFYQHIGFGAVSMLSGWTQFSTKIRKKNIGLHRFLGRVYVMAVLLSGSAGLYLSLYATGGVISGFGFGIMAALWLITTSAAFVTIKNGDIQGHRAWMIRSYALCWSAVTLRIWLPLLQIGLGLGFLSAYLLVSWLCWVPNLLVAEWLVRRKQGVNVSM